MGAEAFLEAGRVQGQELRAVRPEGEERIGQEGKVESGGENRKETGKAREGKKEEVTARRKETA